MRTGLLLLLAAIAGNLWDVISWQSPRPAPPPPATTLPCFAEGVLAHTQPRDSVVFILPDIAGEGGLANHRIRYALPGRYVTTGHDLVPSPDRPRQWVAAWRSSAPPGRVVWRGCEGVLER
jgi:hypothetical protein